MRRARKRGARTPAGPLISCEELTRNETTVQRRSTIAPCPAWCTHHGPAHDHVTTEHRRAVAVDWHDVTANDQGITISLARTDELEGWMPEPDRGPLRVLVEVRDLMADRPPYDLPLSPAGARAVAMFLTAAAEQAEKLESRAGVTR